MGRLGHYAAKIAQAPVEDEEEDRALRRMLPPERERLLRHLQYFADTAPTPEGPHLVGMDTAPGAANARDRFGNWYYISDAGETWRYDPSREGDDAYIRMPQLDTAGRGDRFDTAVRDQVEQRLQDRVLAEMGSRFDIRDQRGAYQEIADRLRPRVEREFAGQMRGRDAGRLGLHHMDAAQRALGQRLYFDHEGRPHTITDRGVEPVDSRRLWAALNPEQAAQRSRVHERQKRQLQNPRYWAAQRRLFATSGEAMPEVVRKQMEQAAQDYAGGPEAFEQEVGTHALAREFVDRHRDATPGMNYDQMLSDAREAITGGSHD